MSKPIKKLIQKQVPNTRPHVTLFCLLTLSHRNREDGSPTCGHKERTPIPFLCETEIALSLAIVYQYFVKYIPGSKNKPANLRVRHGSCGRRIHLSPAMRRRTRTWAGPAFEFGMRGFRAFFHLPRQPPPVFRCDIFSGWNPKAVARVEIFIPS